MPSEESILSSESRKFCGNMEEQYVVGIKKCQYAV